MIAALDGWWNAVPITLGVIIVLCVAGVIIDDLLRWRK